MLHFRRVFRALEHHVFEQMSEAAAALGLQAEADFVVYADGDDGRGRVRRDDHAQPIFQSGVLDGNFE